MAVMSEDGMTDSFAALHAGARGRYTCWDQVSHVPCFQCDILIQDASPCVQRVKHAQILAHVTTGEASGLNTDVSICRSSNTKHLRKHKHV